MSLIKGKVITTCLERVRKYVRSRSRIYLCNGNM